MSYVSTIVEIDNSLAERFKEVVYQILEYIRARNDFVKQRLVICLSKLTKCGEIEEIVRARGF